MRLIFTMLFLLAGFSVWAQTGTITGVVRTSDNMPAEYVTVGIKGTSKGAMTDKKGAFSIKNLTPGVYTLIISVSGLKAEEKTVEITEGETETVALKLSESSQQLEEVVVTDARNKYVNNTTSSSLRLNTPILEVPQNVQVVNSAMLKDQQVISMSDGLIRNVSGLVRAEHWGDLYTNITARGSQIQAFRNGFNVVNSYWGPLTEDMSFVDNIEFVKGPAGFMLSSGDPSGMYNVVTKKPTGVEKGAVTMTMGSFDLFRGTLDLDGKLSKDGKLLYRLNVAAQNKKSHRPNEYNNRYAFAPVVSYQVDDKTKLTLEYNYQRADMSNLGSFYVFSPKGFATLPVNFTMLPANTPGTKIDDHSFYANLQHDINSDWKITAQVARFVYNQVGTSSWPSVVNPDGTMIRNIGIWDAQSRMNMGQIFINGQFKTDFISHKVLAGLDMASKNYLADWSQSHDLDTAGAPFDPNNPNLGVPDNGYPVFDRNTPLEERAQKGYGYQNQQYTSLYLQDELSVLDNKLRLTLAGRYTDLQQAYAGPADKAKHFTPRVGLSASLNKSTAVYALYDQAFVPQSGMMSNGSKVQPITGNNMEVGVKKQWFDGRWTTGLTVYRIIKNNELTPDPNKPPTSGLSIELGQKVSEGLEFDLKGTIARGLTVVANYAYTDSRVLKVADGVTSVKEGDVVPGFAKHTANAWVTYRIQNGPLKGIGISGGFTFLGNRATYWEESPDPDQKLKDYFKVDAGLSWENRKFSINANIFNLLDEYLYSGSYYGWLNAYYWQTDPPRNLRVTLGYRF